APDWPDADLDLIRTWCDFAPTWQNDVPSIRRSAERHVALGDRRGAAILFPSNGDVPLLAVAREHRRRGLGRTLLDATAARAGKPLRIMNVDDADSGIAAFLDRCGARKMIRQIEMVIAPRGGAAA